MSAAAAGAASASSAAAPSKNVFMDHPRYFELTLSKQRGLNLVASRQCRNVDRFDAVTRPQQRLFVPSHSRATTKFFVYAQTAVTICRRGKRPRSKLPEM